jgi:plasmid stabilization system protein ParE
MFELVISVRAVTEIDKAINYYLTKSNKATIDFMEALQKAYSKLEKNPYYAFRYKNIRAIKLRKFPYLLYYVIHEQRSNVRILACFNTKRNPTQRPRI